MQISWVEFCICHWLCIFHKWLLPELGVGLSKNAHSLIWISHEELWNEIHVCVLNHFLIWLILSQAKPYCQMVKLSSPVIFFLFFFLFPIFCVWSSIHVVMFVTPLFLHWDIWIEIFVIATSNIVRNVSKSVWCQLTVPKWSFILRKPILYKTPVYI